MNLKKLIIIIVIVIIIILVCIGISISLYNKPNSPKPSIPPDYSTYPTYTTPIWTPAMCNEYIATCKDRIDKGLIPSSSMNGCIEWANLHQCKL